MTTLIFGPSGSGKTYLSENLRKDGVNAIDTDTIVGLSGWFDGNGKKVRYPENADKDFLNSHQFLWDKNFLKDYISKNSDIYLFGLSGNIFDVIELFDKVYFLKVDHQILKKRLVDPSRANPMGKTEYQRQVIVDYAIMLEEKSKKLGIEFIDATLNPNEIWSILNK